MSQPLVLVRIYNYSLSFTASFLQKIDFQIRTINLDAKLCKLQVWDTAGQDRFKCVVSSFYRGSHGVILCFDITDIDSFRNVDTWLEEITRYCPEQTPVFLVGTKSDLQSKRMVSYSTIKAYADQKQLTYIETSSKTNENIENCFLNFTRTLVTHANQMEINHKNRQTDLSRVNINGPTKPVINGGCMGGNQCSI
jgi:Ras-related protein Rab-1A